MNHARRWVPIAVFVLVPSALILPILFSGRMLFGQDVVNVFHFQRIAIAQAFREGRLPVWDPHVMAGFPLLAEIQGAVFYPPTWLCVVLPAGVFWTLSAWAHLILAGIFAHRWLERGLGLDPWSALAGGFVFMMSGYIVGHLYAGHVNYVWAYPWMAALLWRLERFFVGPTFKRGALLAVVLGMLFLAGVPQFVYFAGLLVLVRSLHFVLSGREDRKDRPRLPGKAAAWLALGLLVCSPQLLPTLELVAQMQRGTADDREFITEHEMKPSELVEIVRSPRTDAWPREFWETCAFLGGGALLLLGSAFSGRHPQRYLWAGIGGAGLLMAMGIHTPVYPGMMVLLPGAGLFRGPGRYLLLFTVAASALVGFGFHALWGRGELRFRIPASLLALAALVQLSVFANEVIEGVEPWTLSWSEQSRQLLRQRAGPDARVATRSAEDIGRCQEAEVDTVCGYDPMMLRRFAELMNAAGGVPPEKEMVILGSVGDHPVIDMLGVSLWIGLPRDRRVPSSRDGPPVNRWTLHDNAKALPRAWVVNNAVVIESKEERLRVLAHGPWDPRKTVILEEYPDEAPPVPTDAPAGTAKVVSKRPGEYVLEARNDADAYLVLSEAYYPGWTAEVDGAPATVLPANHLIQAVRLPPGRHTVRFRYRSRFLGLGFAVAALAVLGPAGVVLVRRRRR